MCHIVDIKIFDHEQLRQIDKSENRGILLEVSRKPRPGKAGLKPKSHDIKARLPKASEAHSDTQHLPRVSRKCRKLFGSEAFFFLNSVSNERC